VKEKKYVEAKRRRIWKKMGKENHLTMSILEDEEEFKTA